jgi:hypothetical protein
VQQRQKAIVVLMALSDEGESNELKLEIAWDGVWSEDSDELVRHMVVKQLNGGTNRDAAKKTTEPSGSPDRQETAPASR